MFTRTEQWICHNAGNYHFDEWRFKYTELFKNNSNEDEHIFVGLTSE